MNLNLISTKFTKFLVLRMIIKKQSLNQCRLFFYEKNIKLMNNKDFLIFIIYF